MVSCFGAGEVILDHCNLHLCNPEMWGMVVRDSSQLPARHYLLSTWGISLEWSQLVARLQTPPGLCLIMQHALRGAPGPAVAAAVPARHNTGQTGWLWGPWPFWRLMDGEHWAESRGRQLNNGAKKVIGGFFCNLRITEALSWLGWQWSGGKLLVIKSPKSSRGMGTPTRFVCHPPSSSSLISALAACSV